MSTHAGPWKCRCGAKHTVSTNVENVDAAPKPGDFTLCIECGEAFQFRRFESPRHVPWRLVETLLAPQPESLAALAAARTVIKARLHETN